VIATVAIAVTIAEIARILCVALEADAMQVDPLRLDVMRVIVTITITWVEIHFSASILKMSPQPTRG
jgi:hypothetical protein